MARTFSIATTGNTSQSFAIDGNYTSVYVRSIEFSPSKPATGIVHIESRDTFGNWHTIQGGLIDLSKSLVAAPMEAGSLLRELRVTVSGVDPATITTVKVYAASLPASVINQLISSARYPVGRLQVDVGNTGFFDSREFRYFREFDIPVNTSWWIKVVVPPAGILLRTQSIELGSGQLRFRAWRDLTISATFVAPSTPADAHTNDASLCSGLFAQNNLPIAPDFTRLTEITQSLAETSVSGGICSEVKRLRTAGATAQQISVGVNTSDERGIGEGTYYLELQSLGTGGSAQGTYNLKFEERIGQG